jgi:hypothetical protein
LIAAAVALILAGVGAAVYLNGRPGPLGVNGPAESTTVSEGSPTPWQTYDKGGRSRLAVLLTRTDASWLPLAHGLKTFGVPFRLTTDWQEAAAHRVILIYPDIDAKALPDAARAGLEAAVRAGATLVAVNPKDPSWKDVFGYEAAKPSRLHEQWRFRPDVRALVPFSDPKEMSVQLTWLGDGRNLDTVTFSSAAETPLADFDDGSSAMLQRHLGAGRTYALGMDVGQLLHISHSLRDEKIERTYVNNYEPTADVFLRLIEALYKSGEPAAAELGTVPMGRALSVLVTHDIDFLDSVKNSLVYAEYEKQAGIRATYFLQTKYVSDASEKAWVTPDSLPLLKRLAGDVPELTSHSVAHSLQFAHFAMGTGREKYPSYKPHVVDENTTDGGTILGELRVSKFLIESLLGVGPLLSFRPGHLSDPYSLPQALKALGFRYSSSSTANNSLTHLPYRLTESRESRVETPLYEFPVTIEDEEAPALGTRLAPALALAETLSGYGGLFVILIHPNDVGTKLEFEKGFVAAWKDRAWFGTVSELGAWWAARDAVEVDVDATAKTATVAAPQAIDGLLLRVPAGWILDRVEPPTAAAESVPGGLLLRHANGTSTLHFR